MVTSAYPDEGKTFVAVNLAASLAMGIDEYVLLLDCDMRNSRIHEMFGYTNSEGLSELLTGKEHLRDLILRTPLEKLSILPAGIAPPNPAELLSSTMMEDLLKDLKARYQNRFIIIDSTPAKGTAEASILANYVDGVILVIMAHKTPRKAIEDTIKSLGRDKILGIVFNGHTQAYKHYQKYYKKY
jgi:capsular exopolysaccharide synthesis family protein